MTGIDPRETDSPSPERPQAGGPGDGVTRLLLFLVGLLALLHFPLVFRLNINWDEFRFLSDVYRFQAGTLTSPLLTFHVHAFGWLPSVGANEVDQIIAARSAYYVLLVGSCGFLYAIARRFLSVAAALFVLLCYLAYAEVLAHGTAFRFDGLAVFLLLGALALLLRRRRLVWHEAGAAVLAAMAFLVTVKTVFYAPTLAMAVMLAPHLPGGSGEYRDARRPEGMGQGGRSPTGWRGSARHFVRFALFFSVALLALYLLHRASLSPTEATLSGRGMLQEAGPRFVLVGRLFPAGHYLSMTLILNLVAWYLLGVGIAMTLLRWWKGSRRTPSVVMLMGLLLPLASLAIYRNAFPYYYAFIVPPALVLCGVPIQEVIRTSEASRGLVARVLLGAATVAVLTSFGVHYHRYFPADIRIQRQVVEAVHEMFPEPVPYIDRGSMIASFPRSGFFMSTIGFSHYRATGELSFDRILREEGPVFILANHPALILDPGVEVPSAPGPDRLREADFRLLQENFVHHWGPIWVAGKELVLTADVSREFEILIPGPYTLEAEGSLWVDGEPVEAGQVVVLEAGPHTATSFGDSVAVVLRWGARLPRPEKDPQAGVLFRDFHEHRR